jgi:hypothetical protein
MKIEKLVSIISTYREKHSASDPSIKGNLHKILIDQYKELSERKNKTIRREIRCTIRNISLRLLKDEGAKEEKRIIEEDMIRSAIKDPSTALTTSEMSRAAIQQIAHYLISNRNELKAFQFLINADFPFGEVLECYNYDERIDILKQIIVQYEPASKTFIRQPTSFLSLLIEQLTPFLTAPAEVSKEKRMAVADLLLKKAKDILNNLEIGEVIKKFDIEKSEDLFELFQANIEERLYARYFLYTLAPKIRKEHLLTFAKKLGDTNASALITWLGNSTLLSEEEKEECILHVAKKAGIEALYFQIIKEQDSFIRNDLLKFYYKTIITFSEQGKSIASQEQKLIEVILQFRYPQMRDTLINLVTEMIDHPVALSFFRENDAKNSAHLLLNLMVASFVLKGVSLQSARKLLRAFFENEKQIKDNLKLKYFLHSLNEIIKEPTLTSIEKEGVLNFLSSIPSDQLYLHFQNINTLLAFKRFDLFRKRNYNEKDLQTELRISLKEKLHIEDEEKYFALINQTAFPNAIPAYATALSNFYQEHIFKEEFLPFLASLFDGTFKEKRYQGSGTLDAISEIRPDLLPLWKAGDRREITLSEGSLIEEPFPSKLEKYLPEMEKEFPKLVQALRDEKTYKEFFNELGKALKNRSLAPISRNKLRLQKTILQLQHPKRSSDQKLLKLVSQKLNDLKILPDLNDFILTELKILNKKCNSKTYTWIDSDDPFDLFLAGTYVDDSCLHIFTGEPKKLVCLMGLVHDGKNRILLIKDRTGRVIKRAIFRLLIDEKKQPVLFLERPYPRRDDNKENENLLIEAAKERARALGIPLLGIELGSGLLSQDIENGYGRTIISHLGKASFEYVDARAAIVENGEYKIDDASLLFDPRVI